MSTASSLTISCSISQGACMPHMPPPHTPCHAHPLPCMPPCHTCPPAMHTPCHICPPAMHTPCHICPPATHAPPATHEPPATHVPCHACPLPHIPTCHACPPPHMPTCHASPHHTCTPATHAPPLPCGQNYWHTLLKILPCPNFVAGGKNQYLFLSWYKLCSLTGVRHTVVSPSVCLERGVPYQIWLDFNRYRRNRDSPDVSLLIDSVSFCWSLLAIN